MTSSERTPIVCTLTASDFKDRLAWINELSRDALQSYERRDLVLDLKYAPEAGERVREMVRKEQNCCAFLRFELRDEPQGLRLTITAPAEARAAADMLFEQFIASANADAACGCRGLDYAPDQ
jgi:hypothetical protein